VVEDSGKKETNMRLNDREIADRGPWEKAGIALPAFDRRAMIAATEKAPTWVHFGAGNIFRAFPAALAQTLLESGLCETGIVVAKGYSGEIVDRMFAPLDNLILLVTLKADGTTEKKVLASVASSHRMDGELRALRAVFANPSLQMASFTITEKGYALKGPDGAFLPDVAGDMKAGPASPASYFGRVAALCHERYVRGAAPLAMVSMDNCSHNGDILFSAIEAFALEWAGNGRVEPGFLEYVRDPKKMSFPCTMIDKITPRPDDGVRDMLVSLGLEEMRGVVTEKNTFVAPFVNAEETQYLVVQDAFPNGRPPLEKAGVLFTDRETVDKVERMKVCTCLNPLHTALAVFGCLLGYTRISEEMRNPDLVALVEGIGYREGLPVVTDPGIIKPREFIDTVIRVRLPNPFMPDAPQRIAVDTSQKVGIRFGGTIRAYMNDKALSVDDLVLIPLVLATWLRYLLGVDDEGKPFSVSPDPMYESLAARLSGIGLGSAGPFRAALEPILSNEKIFGLDLCAAGLGNRIEAYFAELLAGPGAVARTLKKYVRA
jgi:fructuronate reductase